MTVWRFSRMSGMTRWMLAWQFVAACVTAPVSNAQTYKIALGPKWIVGQKFDFVAEINANVTQTDAGPGSAGMAPKVVFQQKRMPLHLEADGEVEEVSPNGAVQKMTLTITKYSENTPRGSARVPLWVPGAKISFIRARDGNLQYFINGSPQVAGEYLFLHFTPIFFSPQTDLELYGPTGAVAVGETWQPSKVFFERMPNVLDVQGFTGVKDIKGNMKLDAIIGLGENQTVIVTGTFVFTAAKMPGFDLYFEGRTPTYQLEIADAYPLSSKGLWKRSASATATTTSSKASGAAANGTITVVNIKTTVEITLR